ncbi:hypothetical protein [Absidia glauca]|uniref:Myb-like domain-containing protein n=1 Tax=Absidia glauca TaxID=4829 RepID=A0A163JPK6_ABSGL|nr:hypothetical protein [Absidia glauca]
MDLATILNPTSTKQQVQPIYLEPTYHHHHHHSALQSPPLSPKRTYHVTKSSHVFNPISNMKPRSRFSALEDAIICQGVANGLTWGQISSQLPHRKRATCFNRYRTLQGVRKSRPHAMTSPIYYHHHYAYDYHHHLPAPHWSPAPLTPTSTPMLTMDTPPMDSARHHQQRRPSICSSLSSSSPLTSPSSLPHHDQWNQDHYTLQPSNASTSPASLYHYCSI